VAAERARAILVLLASGALWLSCAGVPPAAPCGNGVVEAGEQCDDGNARGGDCCAPDCRFEPGGSVCDDGDPCTRFAACNARGLCTGLGCDSGASCSLPGSAEPLSCGVAGDGCACSAMSAPRLPSCAFETRIDDEAVLGAAVARLKRKGFRVAEDDTQTFFAPTLVEAAQILGCDPSDWIEPGAGAP
jgi:cysteine-rich repeat protein